MDKHAFNEHHVLHELKHFLPSQTPLKDFIHHNSLHAFQEMPFYEAIFKARKIFGIHVTFSMNDYRKLYEIGRIRLEIIDQVLQKRKGNDEPATWREKMLQKSYISTRLPRIGRLRANWKHLFHIDLDNAVQPLFFRILCSYLDQGVAIQHFPFENDGLLSAVRQLEQSSFTSFFKHASTRKLLFDTSNCTIPKLLERIVGKEAYFEQYLFDQQFTHRGWSGIVSAIEDNPSSILYAKKVNFADAIILELLLEIDALDSLLGKAWQPLCQKLNEPPLDLFADEPLSEQEEVLSLWQDAFEWSYYDEVLAGVRQLNANKAAVAEATETIQQRFHAIFCIDEREDSIRRHTEEVAPDCETFGCPGFFGVEFFFQPENGKFYEKLCPVVVTPKYLVKEYNVKGHRHHEVLYSKYSHSFLIGFFVSLGLGLWAAFKLFLALFRPKMSPAISDAFAYMHIDGELQIENKSPDDIENGLQIGFTVEEMATRVENLLRSIGMVSRFTPIVYVVAHGSSSANNPHHGAHDCGACSGRPGATNARVFAFMANHPKVRAILAQKGLVIPDSTQFVGAMHDTAADMMGYYDEKILTADNQQRHRENKELFERALDLNAKERSRRFASINTNADLRTIREAIRKRSVSFFEPRPELGHGTNALCFVGNRNLTKGLFLDRRAFMNSYDYRTDPTGAILLNVMKPLPPVCGGINLEYYFSRVDNYKMGAGTKLPHNVMGLIGVANSSDGDLRPGLPLQMIEVHDPVRLLIIVEHYPEIVLKAVQTLPDLYQWFTHGWVHLAAINPDTNQCYYFEDGQFREYVPLKGDIETAKNVHQIIDKSKEMPTNYIVHATEENIPVHILDK
ncbi:MAG: DUF2309 domain-containing protein [Chitinophagales bacterium]|nr:DUF2309 domain-containing protein [Chitinophagales bacterium]